MELSEKNDQLTQQIERITQDPISKSTRNMRWVLSQNIVLQMEHEKLAHREFHKLKNKYRSLEAPVLDLASKFIAAKKIRKKFDNTSLKKRVENINQVKNTIERIISMNTKTKKRPVMQFLLERISIVSELRRKGLSYREMADVFQRLYPRKKVKISHTSIRTFVLSYLDKEIHDA